jgi:RimJ/RimL family protein N-acetyltransferase
MGPAVTLRPFRDSDAERIQEACAESGMQHWLRSLPSPYTLDDAKQFLQDRREKHATGSGLSWAVADPATDVLLANVSLFDVRPGRDAEIGFWTHPAARGRGVMTEACRLVVRHAFVPEEDGGLGLRRLRATAADGNSASVRVILANGFTAVGREREAARLGDGTPVDLLVHDLLEPEWSGLARHA